jgi:hypothetical protein
MTRNFYKVMLGQGSREADACRVHSFLGTDYDVREDLNRRFVWLNLHLWVVCTKVQLECFTNYLATTAVTRDSQHVELAQQHCIQTK